MTNSPPTFFTLLTPPGQGAVAIVQVSGPQAGPIGRLLTGAQLGPACRLVDIAGVDQGLAALPSPEWLQLMPHGGPRVLQLLAAKLRELGAIEGEPDPRALFPEAESEIEASMLLALSRASSPAAIDLLPAQPELWKRAESRPLTPIQARQILDRSARLDHLLTPPTIALAGRANVGKSTLTNRVMGRRVSIEADQPGTTRDWVAGLAMLPTPIGPLAARWLDTPGLRDTHDPIELRAIELARPAIASATLLIALRDPSCDYPPAALLGRSPDLFVCNKADLLGADANLRRSHQLPPPQGELLISASTGLGIDTLALAIANGLGLPDRIAADPLDAPLWAFCPELKSRLQTIIESAAR